MLIFIEGIRPFNTGVTLHLLVVDCEAGAVHWMSCDYLKRLRVSELQEGVDLRFRRTNSNAFG